jgi:hypothetical protein
LSRFERDFVATDQAPVDSVELLLGLIGDRAPLSDELRQRAIACCLSAEDGWREAIRLLGGAFAEACSANTELSEGKID